MPPARLRIVLSGIVFVVLTVAWRAAFVRAFPPDTTPEGAYLRVAKNVSEDHVRDAFAYLETEAQWAAYTIRDARRQACELARASYPAAEAAPLVAAFQPYADAPDGADVFVLEARRRGWVARLRRDLSGVARVEAEGARATVVTARGTRYTLRRRDNGIWGLTLFTADLVAEGERATRDLAAVEAAARDYDRAARR